MKERLRSPTKPQAHKCIPGAVCQKPEQRGKGRSLQQLHYLHSHDQLISLKLFPLKTMHSQLVIHHQEQDLHRGHTKQKSPRQQVLFPNLTYSKFLHSTKKADYKNLKKEQDHSKKKLTSLAVHLWNCKPGSSICGTKPGTSPKPRPPDQKQVITQTRRSG